MDMVNNVHCHTTVVRWRKYWYQTMWVCTNIWACLCQTRSEFLSIGDIGGNTVMVALFNCYMMIRFTAVGRIWVIWIISRVVIILTKEVAEEYPKWVDSEVVGIWVMGDKSTPRCRSVDEISVFYLLRVGCICSLE